jgi:broad specificity phosphatase PhoE
MEAWNSRDIWPGDAGWVSREADVRQSLDAFAAERLAGRDNRRPLVVSSNGILRFLPRLLLPVDLFRPSFKMRTGHLGIVEREGDRAQLRCWDVPPGELR